MPDRQLSTSEYKILPHANYTNLLIHNCRNPRDAGGVHVTINVEYNEGGHSVVEDDVDIAGGQADHETKIGGTGQSVKRTTVNIHWEERQAKSSSVADEEAGGNVRIISPEEQESLGLQASKPRGRAISRQIITVRVFFEVEGFGSFTAGPFNTATGAISGWFGAGETIPLQATAAAGWKFSHWTFNGQFGGTQAKWSTDARIGKKIRAIFIQ